MLFQRINNFINLPIDRAEGDLQSYLKKLDDGSFKDRLCYGIADDKKGFLIVDPKENPGALYCGGMGSGKSIAMKFTVLTHMLANSENTFYLMVDTAKGMSDYVSLFKYRTNVATALNDSSKLIPVIEMLYAEMMERKHAFTEIGANNYINYDKIMREKEANHPGIARILLCAEEFHTIPVSEQIKYNFNVDKIGSAAYMLKEILRVGRSYGICLLAASQRATSDDFPNSLKPGINQLMAFRVTNPSDVSFLGLSAASEIRLDQKGRCAYETGFIQFPYIEDDAADILLKKYFKPLKAKLLKYQVNDFLVALEGEGNAGLVQIKPFKSLFDNWQQFALEEIITRLLKYFEFEVEPQTNPGLASIQLIAKRDGFKYAVNLIKTSKGNTSAKVLADVANYAKILKCDKLICVFMEATSGSMNTSLENMVKNFGSGGLFLDTEDLYKIAQTIDNKAKLEDNGSFEELYNSLSIAKRITPEVVAEETKVAAVEAIKIEEKNKEIDEFLSGFENLFYAEIEKDEARVETKSPSIEHESPKSDIQLPTKEDNNSLDIDSEEKKK